MTRFPFFLVPAVLVCALLAGCGLSTYDVHIIKVHEMIQDMEAIEWDDPGRAAELPETGILVNNKTDTTIRLKMRRKKVQTVDIPPGGSATLALDPGQYHYNFGAASSEGGEKAEEIYIDLRGTKKIVGKILYIYDVITKQEVLKEKELEELRSK